MRLVVASRHGRRGEGLGNELLPWAKGWLASQALNAHLIGPSWGINKRRYYRNFGTSRLDFILEDTLRRMPHYDFSEEDYRETGEIDFGTAIRKWASSRGLLRRRSFTVSVGGMWGGYASIRAARSFLLGKLLNSRHALRNVHEVVSQLDRNKLFVAVHIRSAANEFQTLKGGESARGRFNILVPGEWYLWVCEALQQRYVDRIQFRFFTDRGGPYFDEAVRRFSPEAPRQTGLTECSDLLLMAQADLRVCSVSSYSLAASFLSGGPYVWYEPQLTKSEGLYTLWGDEKAQRAAGSLSNLSKQFVATRLNTCGNGKALTYVPLGAAMDIGDPLPASLCNHLDLRLSSLDRRTNLVEYGCIAEAGRC